MKLALLIAAVLAAAAFALHLVYGWRPAPRRDAVVLSDDDFGALWRAAASIASPTRREAPRVDRDAWPEGVGWTW